MERMKKIGNPVPVVSVLPEIYRAGRQQKNLVRRNKGRLTQNDHLKISITHSRSQDQRQMSWPFLKEEHLS